MITDLFSHKIHSSNVDWQEKLIELASIFAEFDNRIYDRKAIEERLRSISPRAAFIGRDPSKFRDEISAYPAYLGLYRLELKGNYWMLRLSESARRYLISEEPNVGAFMLLQLLLFQYPNGMGVAYSSNSNAVRIQANTMARTFDFIKGGIHLSPLRLICQALQADAVIKNISVVDACVSPKEVFVLANASQVNKKALPQLESVISVLQATRAGKLLPPDYFENRFHILNHTNLIKAGRRGISIRDAIDSQDRKEIEEKIRVVTNVDLQFVDFDHVRTQEEFLDVVRSGSYGRYFDSLLTLNSETVELLATDNLVHYSQPVEINMSDEGAARNLPISYPFRARRESVTILPGIGRAMQLADPEITRIKRQRSNLSHKLILQQLDEYLRTFGVEPLENEHVDLYVEIRPDVKFLFEVKSVNSDNLLSQTRKGLSQLYEYRFRYSALIGYDVRLCLVFPEEPKIIPWLQDYLCLDRGIAVVWFSNNGLQYVDCCYELVRPLLNV